MIRTLALGLAAVVSLVSVAGCAKKPVIPEPVETTAARMPKGIKPSDELIKLCKITFNANTDRAPKFAFDESEVLPQDRDVLVQIARCVTTGPLKGRGLALVGRADPRGETEYNMILGEQRAESVSLYLGLLGVEPERMAKTSRGELDADGADENGWSRDRRVDIDLQPRTPAATTVSAR